MTNITLNIYDHTRLIIPRTEVHADNVEPMRIEPVGIHCNA